MADSRLTRRIRSLVTKDGTLELSLERVPVPDPGPDEVIVRLEASPINPSDLGLLLAGADVSTARASGSPSEPVVSLEIPPKNLRSLKARWDKPLAVGNEGAGVVIEAGSSDAAQSLLGRTVALLGGEMYSELRRAHVAQCLPLPEGTTPEEGASCFVNPLTALGMVETMRLEGHKALVHTAAASNLGQMLQRLCLADGIDLVNIVRRPEQEALLRKLGAVHVCSSSAPSFMEDLTDALAKTGATLAFDATGGGELASRILTAMEAAASRNAAGFSNYGSTTHKQLYIYGGLDTSPTVLTRGYGMAWGIGGWLLPNFLARVGGEVAQRMRERVAAEIKTVFASHYTKTLSLSEALSLEALRAYEAKATGEKYLIDPSRG